MRTKFFAVILILLALVLPASRAHAGGVVTVCDEAHLLTALAGGGTVTFTCSGTITLTATVTISANTTIDGIGQSVTISGNNAVRVFTVNSGATLDLKRLTVTNGRASDDNGGGLYADGGSVNVSNCLFSNNSAAGGGGISASGRLTVIDSTFTGNSARDSGGGILNSGSLTVSNSTFSNNFATSYGGGGVRNYGTLTATASTFTNNSAYNGGGIDNSGTIALNNSTVSGNTTTSGAGGGILNNPNGRVTVNNSIVAENSAPSGGGIYSYDGTVTVNNSTFTGNHGGGISSNNGTLTVSNSTFTGNAAGNGAGIRNSYGTADVTNSTFTGNIGTSGTGGISSLGTLTVINSTVSGNSGVNGGGIRNFGYTVILKNTIGATNLTGGNCSGTITDGGGNLSYPDTTCPGINADPKLGPLQNDLGPTQTMALGPGSAAIDAGIDAICAAAPVNGLDQRGIARPWGAHCDIGAVEQVPIKSMWLPAILAR